MTQKQLLVCSRVMTERSRFLLDDCHAHTIIQATLHLPNVPALGLKSDAQTPIHILKSAA